MICQPIKNSFTTNKNCVIDTTHTIVDLATQPILVIYKQNPCCILCVADRSMERFCRIDDLLTFLLIFNELRMWLLRCHDVTSICTILIKCPQTAGINYQQRLLLLETCLFLLIILEISFQGIVGNVVSISFYL